MAREPGGAELTVHVAELTDRLVSVADPAHPFLWAAVEPGDSGVVHRPGFLDGAAGAALALRFATTPDAPSGELPWQAALLLC